jgi:hypothetical protein
MGSSIRFEWRRSPSIDAATEHTASDPRQSRNVSGTAVSDRDPPIRKFFPKKLEGVLEHREGREFRNARAWGVYS